MTHLKMISRPVAAEVTEDDLVELLLSLLPDSVVALINWIKDLISPTTV